MEREVINPARAQAKQSSEAKEGSPLQGTSAKRITLPLCTGKICVHPTESKECWNWREFREEATAQIQKLIYKARKRKELCLRAVVNRLVDYTFLRAANTEGKVRSSKRLQLFILCDGETEVKDLPAEGSIGVWNDVKVDVKWM